MQSNWIPIFLSSRLYEQEKKIDEDDIFFLLIRKVGMTKYEEKRSVLGKSVIP